MFIYLKVVLSKGINIDLVKVIFIIVIYLNISTLRSIIRTHPDRRMIIIERAE